MLLLADSDDEVTKIVRVVIEVLAVVVIGYQLIFKKIAGVRDDERAKIEKDVEERWTKKWEVYTKAQAEADAKTLQSLKDLKAEMDSLKQEHFDCEKERQAQAGEIEKFRGRISSHEERLAELRTNLQAANQRIADLTNGGRK